VALGGLRDKVQNAYLSTTGQKVDFKVICGHPPA
jgi:hypothetical protein